MLHTFLLSLEERLKKERKPPEVLFFQIDGGSENTAKSVIAMMELLVAQRLGFNIVLSRLPVGHTHEDIDAKFAKIWKRIRNAHVLSVAMYQAHVIQVQSLLLEHALLFSLM
jgi:hypothetical protein